MKSRKFKAVLAAVSAIAVLATAMTGFAATLNTTTTYNLADNKVSVKTVVTDVNDGTQVTYLVKTAAGGGVGKQEIAYIDQKAASDGATFEWQIDRTVLSDATVAGLVTVGNDEGDATVTGDLGVKAIAPKSETGYTVTYVDAEGNAVDYAGTEEIKAVVTVDSDYELRSVTVGTDDVYTTAQQTYPVDVVNGIPETVTANVEKKVTTPVIDSTVHRPAVEDTVNDKGEAAKKNTTIFKIDGFDANNYEAGVEYQGEKYPAVHGLGQEYIIVQLITKDGLVTNATPYCDAR